MLKNNFIQKTAHQKVLTVEDNRKGRNHCLMIAATAIESYHPKPIRASHLCLDNKKGPWGRGSNIESNESKIRFGGH